MCLIQNESNILPRTNRTVSEFKIKCLKYLVLTEIYVMVYCVQQETSYIHVHVIPCLTHLNFTQVPWTDKICSTQWENINSRNIKEGLYCT